MVINPLDETHNRTDFNCGDPTLNRWFQQTALQHKKKELSSSFVALNDRNSSDVLGFYAITMAQLHSTDLPTELSKRLPIKVPVFCIGRLATGLQHQQMGIGSFLLLDAIDRITRVAYQIGGTGIIVNAKPNAIGFYEKHGFVPIQDSPLNLYLPIF